MTQKKGKKLECTFKEKDKKVCKNKKIEYFHLDTYRHVSLN